MKHNIKAPSVGESVTEVSILKWAKQNGQQVKTGDLLLEIESDKATVEIVAEATGALSILKPAGERINVGTVIGEIDDAVQGTVGPAAKAAPAPTPAAPHVPTPPAAPMAAAAATPSSAAPLSPAVRKAVVEHGLDTSQISGTGKGGRLTKGDILSYLAGGTARPTAATPAAPAKAGERRVQMSMLRSRIAERLVQAQHNAAILTTFNEADMSAVMALRNKHKDSFKAKHGVPLSFMSFFTMASVEALKAVPEVNAYIEGREIVYHDYYDIGIAVGTERGLVVPIIRGAEKMSVVDMEKKLAELAIKARDGKLSINDMSGGTFTISNGGVYGSLLSTPILNPPQSGILGMHKIQERPVAVNGKVEIRPMMYLALSYDHRIIDGKGAVTFLVTLKDFIEHPEKLKMDL
jgi:2-oxoglutarate dehydrogenase E2 component (dihydrolipoamide succinyltransferase)